jgi:hypothetical protein
MKIERNYQRRLKADHSVVAGYRVRRDNFFYE